MSHLDDRGPGLPQGEAVLVCGEVAGHHRTDWKFGLSRALGWFLLGYWLRRREQADITTAATLTLLLTLTFFARLVGFLITAAALGVLAVRSRVRRWRNLGWVVLAAAPAALLGL